MQPAREPLRLGLFMPNCSNMYAISSWKVVADEWTWPSNLAIARAAEDAGFDLLFPVSRWRGFGGSTDYLGTSLETMTWASALLAQTSRIQVFSTVHVPVFHPVVVAKMGATLDHLGGGRWGINLVSGWSREEFAMMGMELLPHAERYQRTAAFIEILRGLWTAPPGTFNHESPWYRVENGVSLPQPPTPPPIANAGVSDDARDVIARLCDWAFVSTPSIEATPAIVADVKARAVACGRSVRAAAFPFVLWRDSADEAEAEIARIVEHKDAVAAQNWLDGLNIGSGSFDSFTLDMMSVGAGAVHVVGTAEDVAVKLKALHDGGLDAVLMVFQGYLDDTRRFAREVLPLLREMGVRGDHR
ncbi:MAG: LLM class flavin-dependent oxidoreductase [Gammaproteobacteria bacterium]